MPGTPDESNQLCAFPSPGRNVVAGCQIKPDVDVHDFPYRSLALAGIVAKSNRDVDESSGTLMSALRFIRLPEVLNRTGLSRTEVYRRMDEETFPKVIPLGKRSIAWRSDEIDAWIADVIARAGKVAATRHVHRKRDRLRAGPGDPARPP